MAGKGWGWLYLCPTVPVTVTFVAAQLCWPWLCHWTRALHSTWGLWRLHQQPVGGKGVRWISVFSSFKACFQPWEVTGTVGCGAKLWGTGRDVAVAAFPGAHLRLSLRAQPGTEESSALPLCCCVLLDIPQVLSCRALSFWWVPHLWLPL